MAELTLELVSEGDGWSYLILDNNFAALETGVNNLDLVSLRTHALNWKHFNPGLSLYAESGDFRTTSTSSIYGFSVEGVSDDEFNNKYPGYSSLNTMSGNEAATATGSGWSIVGKATALDVTYAQRFYVGGLSLETRDLLVLFNAHVTEGSGKVFFALQVSGNGTTWTTLTRTVRCCVFPLGFNGDVPIRTLITETDAPTGLYGVRAVCANDDPISSDRLTISRWNLTVLPFQSTRTL
jgi:hypothetical protein